MSVRRHSHKMEFQSIQLSRPPKTLPLAKRLFHSDPGEQVSLGPPGRADGPPYSSYDTLGKRINIQRFRYSWFSRLTTGDEVRFPSVPTYWPKIVKGNQNQKQVSVSDGTPGMDLHRPPMSRNIKAAINSLSFITIQTSMPLPGLPYHPTNGSSEAFVQGRLPVLFKILSS